MSKNWQRPNHRDALLQDREGAYAIARHIRMSPQKVRRVVDMVRGMPVNDALATLRFAPQAASEPVYKVIASAVANAENGENLHANDLYVSQIFVDEGATMRRFRARAKGQGARILKRTSHITAVVEPLSGKGLGIPMSTQAVTKRLSEVVAEQAAKAPVKQTPKAAEAKPAEDKPKRTPRAKKVEEETPKADEVVEDVIEEIEVPADEPTSVEIVEDATEAVDDVATETEKEA